MNIDWSPRRLDLAGRALVSSALLGTLIFGAVSWQTNAAQDRADEAQTKRLAVVELSGKNLSQQLDKQRAQFKACVEAAPDTEGCATPIAPPAIDVAPAVVTGPRGEVGPGPTAAQVGRGVAVYFARHPAPKGKDGLTPKPSVVAAQIKTAVAISMATNPPSDGTDGTNGSDSTTPGPAGQDASDVQVAAAVAAYCDAHDQCRGAAGPPGEPPYSWTTTDKGVTFTCTRDDPFDPSKPAYHCEPTPTGAPTP